MKFAIVLSSALIATATSVDAWAQDDISSCVALANVIATGETVQFSTQEIEAIKYYSICQSKEENNSGGLEITSGVFSFGGDMSDAQKETYCKNSKDNFNSSTTYYVKSKQVFQSTLATINACIESTRSGWRVQYNIFDRDAVSIGISNNSDRGGQLAGVDVYPSGSLSCNGTPQFPTVVTTTNFVSMTCTRTPTQTMVDGTNVTSAADATINLRLATKPFPIRLPGYTTSIFKEMRAEIDRLAQRLSEMESAGYVKSSDLQSNIEGAGFVRFGTNLSVRDSKAPSVAISRHGDGGNYVSPYQDTADLDGPAPSRVWILKKE